MSKHNLEMFLASLPFLLLPLPSESQDTHQIHIGPESARTVVLDSVEVLYRIGDATGPGMLEQGTAVTMTSVPSGGLLIFTAYSAEGPIQHFRGSKLARTFGRKGDGPGEYRQISGLAVDPTTGETWVQDRARMVSFSEDGEPGTVIQKHHAGPNAGELLFLPDGSLLLLGPGGRTDNLGNLLHKYNVNTGTWSSHYPLFRDSVFVPSQDVRKWRRRLALSRDNKVVAVSDGYVIEILDPTQGFEVLARISRRPVGWPKDIIEDDSTRRRENPFQPGYAVIDAGIDDEGHLWVVSVMPEKDWEDDLREAPGKPFGKTFISDDLGMDSLVEVFDLSERTLLASYQLDQLVRFIVGPGELAYYLGDLPFPRYEIVRLSLEKELMR